LAEVEVQPSVFAMPPMNCAIYQWAVAHLAKAPAYFEVLRALRIAISGTVLRTGLVVRLSRGTSVERHGAEVNRAVETASELRHVDGESELLVDELQRLVAL
jgi:hypothetical protein